MLWNKKIVLVKGYALVYTMLAGMIIIMIVGFGFTIEVKRRTNIEKYEKNVEENQCGRETKEFLLSKMNSLIFSNALKAVNHITDLNKGEVKIILSSIDEGYKIGCSDCYIFYDKPSDKIIIRVSSYNSKVKNYIYDYDVSGDRIKYVFLLVKTG